MDAGARVIHFDVMDGHFVPPITIGPLVAAAIADQVHDAGGAIDVHLMIEAPERQIEAFAEAGADSITFHVEATPHANRTLTRDPRARLPGRASRSTPAPRSRRSPSCAGLADIVLCMTVNPGWGGQAFIESSPDKVARLGAARSATPRSRSTAASTPRPPARWPRPAPPSSSPAPPSSAPPTPLPPTRRSPPPRAPRRSDVLVDGGEARLQLLRRAGLGHVLGPLVRAAVDEVEQPEKQRRR